MNIPRHPLSFYVDKLIRGEPFSSLLYGDGEFTLAMRTRSGNILQSGEIATPELEQSLLDSLAIKGDNIYRGTDPNLINWWEYQGRDDIKTIGVAINALLEGRDVEFVDGTIWDEAVRNGELAPLLKVLHDRPMALVSNLKISVAVSPFLHPEFVVSIPMGNAAATVSTVAPRVREHYAGGPLILVVCMGLGAIPLILKLREVMPAVTFLDLGSVLDLFASIGDNRGWRRELYAKPKDRKELVAKNLEGVCSCSGRK